MRSSKVVGGRVRLARIEMGLSPEQFGERFGISGMTVRRLEDGRQKRLTARSMMLIARGLDVPVGELFEP
jgi:transcriptional regulator with XRE-family HTH domain